MGIIMDTVPEFNKNINFTQFLLDPLSVIVKLAIISNKPVGTKFRISDNTMLLQEPGIWQGIVRGYFRSDKNEIIYLYNPIQQACLHFLNTRFTDKTPNIVKLFICANRGLDKLKETYSDCPMVVICLHFYSNLIENLLDNYDNNALFKKDFMTSYYNADLISSLNGQWTNERIKLVLDLIEFLCKDYSAGANVQSLEIFMNNIDQEIKTKIV
jgi:hypothetical protein